MGASPRSRVHVQLFTWASGQGGVGQLHLYLPRRGGEYFPLRTLSLRRHLRVSHDPLHLAPLEPRSGPWGPRLLPLGFPLTPDSRNSASRRYFKTSDCTLFSIFRCRPLKPSSLSPHQRLPKTHSSFESTTLPTRILTWLLQECVHNRPSVSLRAVGGLGHCLFKTVLEETTWAKLAGRTLRDPTRLAFLTNREVISPEVDR